MIKYVDKALFKLLFICIDVILLMAMGHPGEITQKRLNNLKTADIVGVIKKLPKGMGSSLAWEESRGVETAAGKNNTNDFYSYGLCGINEQYEEYFANKYLPGGYAIYDRFNPEHSAIIGMGILYDLHEKFGNWKEALCAYNWGEGKVAKCKSYSEIPLRVRNYANRILSRIVVKEHNYLDDIKKESLYKKYITSYTRIQDCIDIRKYLLVNIINNFVDNNISAKRTRNSNKYFI